MSGLALPPSKLSSKKPQGSAYGSSSNAAPGSSKSGLGNNRNGNGNGEDEEEDMPMEKRVPKAIVGVPEITAVQGLVPTLQWVSVFALTCEMGRVQKGCRSASSRRDGETENAHTLTLYLGLTLQKYRRYCESRMSVGSQNYRSTC